MKISTYIEIMLVVGIIFYIFGSMITETSVKYPDASMTDDNLTLKYDFSVSINNSVAPLYNAIQTISDTETGWFSKLTSGLSAIPYAVILLPSIAIKTIAYGITVITGGWVALGVATNVLAVVFVMIIVWIVFKLIEVFQRWQL